MKLLIIFALAVVWYAEAPSAPLKPVRVLAWWDYIPQAVVDDLRSHGFEPQITTYRSNDAVISRLSHNRENFDVAIISSIALESLKNPIRPTELIGAKSPYESIFDSLPSTCLPYMWSATVFSYDGRSAGRPPETLAELLNLKSKGFSIGILDDPYEVRARIALDRSSTIKDLSDPPSMPGLDKKDFSSSIPGILTNGRGAVYGWHGEAASASKTASWLKFSVPKNGVVVGYDSVCVFNRKSKANALAFAEIIARKDNIAKTMKATQYFSPYVDHTEGLSPQVKALRLEVLEMMRRKKTHLIPVPDERTHRNLNEWWAKVRYGS